MTIFRTIRKYLAPRWLTEEEGELVGYSLDLMKDGFAERTLLSLLARFPQQDAEGTPGPEDALTALGRDRRVVRGIGESTFDYAARLPNWLVDRRRAGNPFVLMKQLAGYCGSDSGCSFRTVDNNGNWYFRDASGVESQALKKGNWDWDSDVNKWSRFWVIIHPGAFWNSEPTWGGGTWGDTSGTIGTSLPPEQATTLRAIVQDWKPGGTIGDIIIAFDGASFDYLSPEPDGSWGKWYVYDAGVAIPSRLGTARYFGA